MMLDVLRQVPLFSSLTDDQLQWVFERVSELDLNQGDLLFAEGSPADYFYVLLDGELEITKRTGGVENVLTTHESGGFTGEIPLLTGTTHVASARASRASHLLKISAADFHQMLNVCVPVASTILPTIAWRVQTLEMLMRQREKMAALGQLSAGLAHELNNPAAAGQRAAEQLRNILQSLQVFTLKLNQQQLSLAAWEFLTEFERKATEKARIAREVSPLDPLAQSDLEDDLTTLLDEYGIADGWKLAHTLVEAGLDVQQLRDLVDHVGVSILGDVLGWLEARLAASELVDEVEQSTRRISDLVKAIKEYSYMDQAPQQEVDIHQGLESTLTILHYKLEDGITVTREYDRSLPRIFTYGSELNQVWTNLIDNAIDAMKGRGQIWIRTSREGDHVLVEIADNGPGIPPEIQARIFEPFFTTKRVGEGSGLGLNISYRIIVERHHGDLSVTSRPGDTCFQVRLPIA